MSNPYMQVCLANILNGIQDPKMYFLESMEVMYNMVSKHLFSHTFVYPLLPHRGLREHTHGVERSSPDIKQDKT